jgi:hypothetical protein
MWCGTHFETGASLLSCCGSCRYRTHPRRATLLDLRAERPGITGTAFSSCFLAIDRTEIEAAAIENQHDPQDQEPGDAGESLLWAGQRQHEIKTPLGKEIASVEPG